MLRQCIASNERGEPCRQPPLLGGEHCFWHDPDHQQEAAEARRLGGMRRRRESTIVGAFEVGDLASVEELRRLLQIAVADTLSLENSIARNRTLGYLTQVGSVLLEKGEMEARLDELEATLAPRLVKPDVQERQRRRWSSQ
jgi:hypothetical protein